MVMSAIMDTDAENRLNASLPHSTACQEGPTTASSGRIRRMRPLSALRVIPVHLRCIILDITQTMKRIEHADDRAKQTE